MTSEQPTDEVLECGCGLPLSKNPHPEAGTPTMRILEVGAIYECIPCLVAGRHKAFERYTKAERRIEELTSDAARVAQAKAAMEEALRRMYVAVSSEMLDDWAEAFVTSQEGQ